MNDYEKQNIGNRKKFWGDNLNRSMEAFLNIPWIVISQLKINIELPPNQILQAVELVNKYGIDFKYKN